MAYNETLAQRIREALISVRGVKEVKMFGGIAFMWKDRMFCGVMKNDMMVRVLNERYEELVEQKYARPMDFVKSRPMHSLIYVSLDGLKTTKQLSGWIAEGKEYVKKSPAKKKVSKKKSS